jgi:uncharacterized protein (TIGR00296 family)
MLQQEGEFLVKLSRNAFVMTLTEVERVPVPPDVPADLWERHGVFVRVARSASIPWTKDMEILGCFGYPFPLRELVLATIDSMVACAVRIAASNAFKTSRLDNLLFEVSVLTRPELLTVRKATEYPKRIVLGKDGLIVQRGLASGLILPQVSIEENYDEKDLLSECCLKAGLPSDSWLTLHDIDVYRFQAEIFRETGTNGKVVKFEPNVSKACETS